MTSNDAAVLHFYFLLPQSAFWSMVTYACDNKQLFLDRNRAVCSRCRKTKKQLYLQLYRFVAIIFLNVFLNCLSLFISFLSFSFCIISVCLLLSIQFCWYTNFDPSLSFKSAFFTLFIEIYPKANSMCTSPDYDYTSIIIIY